MLSWKIMKATEAGCQNVCNGEQAAAHYACDYPLWYRWKDWWRGFVTEWMKA